MSLSLEEQLRTPAEDYFWLLSKGYPQKPALKMVGDKYELSRDLRQVLYRGISSRTEVESRTGKIGTIREGDRVGVDTYNVLFTVNNYLLGKHVFISNDGFLRDAGEMRGRIIRKPVFARSVRLLLEGLRQWEGSYFSLYLDEPVSHSGRLSAELTERMAEMGIRGKACTVPSPDRILAEQHNDVVCTSDSVIIDRFEGRVADLPRILLDNSFQPGFPSLVFVR